MAFDAISYFSKRDIEYFTEGKNVSKGWVNIQCPYPDCNDTSNHCGVKVSDGRVSCWKCGPHGNVVNLISLIDKCSYARAKEIAERYSTDGSDISDQGFRKSDTRNQRRIVRVLPKNITKKIPKPAYGYLKRRGFNPRVLARKYDLWFPDPIYLSKYAYRIIVPFKMKQQVVGYTAMAMIRGKNIIPYMHSPKEKSRVARENYLYNIDSVTLGGVAAICEGITDAWRISQSAVATLGVAFTRAQLALLAEKDIRKAIVIYDGDRDGWRMGDLLAKQLAPIIPEVLRYKLKRNDPDKLSLRSINEIRTALIS